MSSSFFHPSIHWVSDRCRDDFALWCVFVRKKCPHTNGNFSFFMVFTTRHSLSFLKFEILSCLFWLIMPCLLVDGTWKCLIIDLSFFFCGIMSFYVSISDVFFSLQVFQFWSQCLAEIMVLMCSVLFFILFYWASGHCTSEFALECYCLNKVVTNW